MGWGSLLHAGDVVFFDCLWRPMASLVVPDLRPRQVAIALFLSVVAFNVFWTRSQLHVLFGAILSCCRRLIGRSLLLSTEGSCRSCCFSMLPNVLLSQPKDKWAKRETEG